MNAIEQYRADKGLTCEALAQLVGVSKATISRHCRGFPIDGETALLYKAKLGIPVETLRPELFTGLPDPSTSSPGSEAQA